MDCCACYKSIPLGESLPAVVKSKGGFRVFSALGSAAVSESRNLNRQNSFLSQNFGAKITCGSRGPTVVTVASAKSSKCEFWSVETPLEPRSSAGKFLSGILKNHRHIFHIAAAEQLEDLAANRDDAVARQQHSLGSTESCLHGRIAEMKEQECQIAIEEVMYMLIVHKFSEVNVPMVPSLSRCISNGRLETWASKDTELESIHGFEVLEMIKQHLSTILGLRGKSDITDNWTVTHIRRLQLGRVYAASIMYGYFLKSACQRHYLEQNLALSHYPDLHLSHTNCLPLTGLRPCASENIAVLGVSTDILSSLYQGSGIGRKSDKLMGYVMGFDPEALQRCAKLKSREAVNLIENHTWALFGDEKTGNIEKDEVVAVKFSSLKRLVLEAVAFGSFLWDVEGYVGSVYQLKEN